MIQDLQIKVCGMTDIDQVKALAGMGVDYAGFIFYGPSPRYAAGKIKAAALQSFGGIKKVGVFVNENTDVVLQTVADYGLDYVQLHGNETAAAAAALRQKTKVIKAFGLKDAEDTHDLLFPYLEHTDLFLFDTPSPIYGGTGLKFNWDLLQQLAVDKPFFLSGGIGPGDAITIQDFSRTQKVYGIDLNSRFETTPGNKDMGLIRKFLDQLSHVS